MSIKKNIKNQRIYLDIASQTLPSDKVLKEMNKVSNLNYNPANLYEEGILSNNILEEARKRVTNILGVKNYEIYFTNSGTMSCATATLGLVEQYKKDNLKKKNYIKPHIITSNIEHSAVYENIKYLERNGEIEVTYIECDEFGLIDKNKIKNKIKKNTILITIMFVNNEIGTIQDIKGISKKIKEWKSENKRSINNYPFFHTDAAQAANYLSLYVDRLGVDMMSLNGSKIYGPKSTGILFKKEYLKILPVYYGGGQERGLFSGTVDVRKCVGLATALEEAQNNLKNIKSLETLSIKRNYLAKSVLENITEVKINGFFDENEWRIDKQNINRELRISKRVPNNLSIYLPDFPSDEMVIRLNNLGYAVSAGSACSAKDNSYSRVIFSLYKNKLKKLEAIKRAKETIRITFDNSIKEKDLKSFAKDLKSIYYKFKK